MVKNYSLETALAGKGLSPMASRLNSRCHGCAEGPSVHGLVRRSRGHVSGTNVSTIVMVRCSFLAMRVGINRNQEPERETVIQK